MNATPPDPASQDAELDLTTFAGVLRSRLSRRHALQVGLVATTAAALPSLAGTTKAAAQTTTPTAPAPATPAAPTAGARRTPPTTLSFTGIQPQKVTDDAFRVAPGYTVDVLLRWGDAVLPGAPAFDLGKQTAASQAMQCGYNHDFQGFFPISSNANEGVFFVSHEYTSGALMFPGYNARTTDLAQLKAWVDIELEAHGGSIVEIERANATSAWKVRMGKRNRRITGTTPMRFSGPAATDFRLQGGVTGMFNNCAGGKTPWGTVLTCEENFNQYFANSDTIVDAVTKAAHKRYGVTNGATDRGWEKVYPRFDSARTPDEPYKYGWVVEVDPDDPTSTPVKRTALGRFKHEAATTVISPTGQVVVYSGDDERFDYFYKFVSYGMYDPAKGKANGDLLDSGTLYVAKLWPDGAGEWIPLVHNSRTELRAGAGFVNQADVLLRTRLAGDAVGATKMDRPEDIETNPLTGKVYVACTNNANRRSTVLDEGEMAANPRFNATTGNRTGHIIELTEKDNVHSAMQFRWEIFMLVGDPAAGRQVTSLRDVRAATDTYFAGYAGTVSPIGAPDNVAFSPDGMLWVGTDGAPAAVGYNDSLSAVPTTGPNRGMLRQFLSVPAGAEVCGPEFTPDQTTLFIAVQHPGEDGPVARPGDPTSNMQSHWPDGGNSVPKSASVAIRHNEGKIIGS